MATEDDRLRRDGAGNTLRADASTLRGIGLFRGHVYAVAAVGAAQAVATGRAEWAYERLYRDSNERSQALHAWLSYYNFHRHHGSLNRKTPAARLNELNNVLGNYN
jgi:putative transposase